MNKEKLLGIAMIIILIIITSCKQSFDENLFRSLDIQCSQKENCIIKANEINKLNWDTMIFFSISATPEDMRNVLGRNETGWRDLTEQIVFLLKGNVIHREYMAYNPESPPKVSFDIGKKRYEKYFSDELLKVYKPYPEKELYLLSKY